MPPDLPQPSRLLIAASSGVIAANLLFVALSLAAVAVFFVADPNPIAFVGLLLLAPPCLIVARLQYRATFHRAASAANILSILLYCFIALVIFGYVSNVGEGIVYRDESLSDALPFALIFGLICGIIGAAAYALARLNGRWAEQLEAAIDAGAAPLPRHSRPFARTRTARLAFPLALLAATALVAWLLVMAMFPSRAEHVTVQQARLHLPYAADDISYCRAFWGNIAYEFTTREDHFRTWVEGGIGPAESQAADVPLVELTAPAKINRYGSLSREPDDPEEVEVSSGLSYAWENADCKVHALFDRTTGRGYYHAQFD